MLLQQELKLEFGECESISHLLNEIKVKAFEMSSGTYTECHWSSDWMTLTDKMKYEWNKLLIEYSHWLISIYGSCAFQESPDGWLFDRCHSTISSIRATSHQKYKRKDATKLTEGETSKFETMKGNYGTKHIMDKNIQSLIMMIFQRGQERDKRGKTQKILHSPVITVERAPGTVSVGVANLGFCGMHEEAS